MAKNSVIRAFAEAKRDYYSTRQDYAASTPSRFRRQRSGLWGSADSHYANERRYFESIEYIRDMERNDGLIKSTLDIAVNQQVQGGFGFDPLVDDEKLREDLKADHEEWANDPRQCDIAGEKTFSQFTEQALRSQTRDGDHIVLGTAFGSLQEMECERLKTPRNSRRNIVHGVQLDEYRRRVAYFLTKGEVDPMTRVERVGDMNRVETLDEEGYRQVFHVLHPRRVTQTRGVSEFIAVQDRMGILEDIEFSLVIKQQLAAMLVGSKESALGTDGADSPLGPRETVTDSNGANAIEEKMAPGTILKLKPGQKFNFHSPNITSTESLQHIRQTIQVVGLQVGMPLIMMLMDATETNFSGWRGAIDIARTLFRSNQKHLASRFCTPAAVFRIRWRMQRDDSFGRSLRAAFKKHGDGLFKHQWHFPGWPYVQPLHDVQSDALKLTTLISSPRRVCADRGYTFATIVQETVADNYFAIDLAIQRSAEIKAKHGVDVHWRELLNRDLYDGGQTFDSLDEPNASGSSKPDKQPKARSHYAITL